MKYSYLKFKTWLNNYKSDDGRIYFMRFLPPSINKVYADFKLFVDKKRGYPKLKALFNKRIGYKLNLDNPRSFNEKIIWKKLYDRNPLLTVTADKYEVRGYLKNILGDEEADKLIVPVYYVTSDPHKIPFSQLPDRFVIKPNHGSRMHIIHKGDKPVCREYIQRKCKEWLRTNYGFYHYEWAYRNIKRKIILEELLETGDGSLPMDYKFYCFNSKCRLIRVSDNRFGSDDNSAYLDIEWNLLPVVNPGYNSENIEFKKPANPDYLINLAEKISADFDAVRVDFYYCDGRAFFSELTHYDGSGLARFEPESFDFELGSFWKILPEYWKRKN